MDINEELQQLENLRKQKFGSSSSSVPTTKITYNNQYSSPYVHDSDLERFELMNEELDVRKDIVIKRAEQISKEAEERNERESKRGSSRPTSKRETWRDEASNLANEVSISAKFQNLSTNESFSRPTSSSRGRFDQSVSKSNNDFIITDEIDPPPIQQQLQPRQLSVDELDEDEKAAAQLGPEAERRFLKAKLHVLKEELEAAHNLIKEKDAMINESKSKANQSSDTQAKLQKQNQSLEQQLEKSRKGLEEAQKKATSLEQQLNSAKREIEQLSKSQKQTEQEKGQRDTRLNRALDDLERYKQALKEAQSSGKDQGDEIRKKLDKQIQENRKLQKRQQDLQTLFRKQMKLIDILKRQRVHMEAATLLHFTEDEFLKTLDRGEQL
eukprot:TRINITY_DN5203_c0_g1_i1.p1 TRINITY_DN5203_c0_g1~~TRINITY_DN5203_c0_g1_i1.p1  ORF type:complete len:384 (+),score=97.41 TRINITY_DN5203_c0_g1_i1:102-1253(+)